MNKCLVESCFPPFGNPPIISEIFESFINDSFTKHLDITGLISDLQYGFRPFWSIVDILTVLSERIYNLLDAGEEMRAIALDKGMQYDLACMIGLDLYTIYGLEAIYIYIQYITKAVKKSRPSFFLTPESILYLYKSTFRPCMEYCSHIWGSASRSHVLDLFELYGNL